MEGFHRVSLLILRPFPAFGKPLETPFSNQAIKKSPRIGVDDLRTTTHLHASTRQALWSFVQYNARGRVALLLH
jgi:hypothetical protein